MLGLVGGLVGGGVGLLRGLAQHNQEKAIEDSDRRLAAETARYSPWTGMQPQAIRHASNSAFGSMLGGAVEGAMGGSQLGSAFGAAGAPPAAAAPLTGNASIDSSNNIWGMMGQSKQQPYQYSAMQRPSIYG